jgi:serine/threonine-protein phosphatase 2A regulatory subunit B''
VLSTRARQSKLTLADLARSNLVRVLHYVDQEPDINKVMDYFSYEHFYVLYCKFWELDADHDFLLDREDVVKLCNYALTYRIVDRIFAGACRPLHSGVPDRVGYQDFIWLLLSEEDKTSETAIRYWFRGIDLDGDGYITPHEMEFFYKEQLHRMDCLAQEVVQFEDILCQMTDMVKPEREGFISMMDLKRCRQAGVFFNVLFNLTKFIQYDQKDPGQIFNERATPELTDWGRYAKLEYARLAMEEDQGEYGEEEAWEMEQDAEQPTGES